MTSETPPDVDDLLAKAIDQHRNGSLTQAEWGYLAVLEVSPQNADALHLLGVVAHQMGSTNDAINHVNESLAVNPDQPRALNNLGNMLADVDRMDEAIERYQRAIELEPEYAQAHHNLGNVLSDRGRLAESMDCYRRSIQILPGDVESRISLGRIYDRQGAFEEAANEYRESIRVDPTSNAARARLGAVLRKQGKLDEARTVYDEWLERSPENPIAEHFRAACEGANPPDRASVGYIKQTFDSFAEDFDEQLAELKYRVPELFEGILQAHLSEATGQWNIADLGCGTGLCAPFLRKHADTLVGVDLSTVMLEKAGEKGLYDELHDADLIEYLQSCPEQFELLVAADALIYTGDLRSTMETMAAALKSGGLLLFNVEKLDDQAESEFQLEPSGRFSHKIATVKRWLSEAGFDFQEIKEAELRQEGLESVTGFLVLAKLASAG